MKERREGKTKNNKNGMVFVHNSERCGISTSCGCSRTSLQFFLDVLRFLVTEGRKSLLRKVFHTISIILEFVVWIVKQIARIEGILFTFYCGYESLPSVSIFLLFLCSGLAFFISPNTENARWKVCAEDVKKNRKIFSFPSITSSSYFFSSSSVVLSTTSSSGSPLLFSTFDSSSALVPSPKNSIPPSTLSAPLDDSTLSSNSFGIIMLVLLGITVLVVIPLLVRYCCSKRRRRRHEFHEEEGRYDGLAYDERVRGSEEMEVIIHESSLHEEDESPTHRHSFRRILEHIGVEHEQENVLEEHDEREVEGPHSHPLHLEKHQNSSSTRLMLTDSSVSREKMEDVEKEEEEEIQKILAAVTCKGVEAVVYSDAGVNQPPTPHPISFSEEAAKFVRAHHFYRRKLLLQAPDSSSSFCQYYYHDGSKSSSLLYGRSRRAPSHGRRKNSARFPTPVSTCATSSIRHSPKGAHSSSFNISSPRRARPEGFLSTTFSSSNSTQVEEVNQNSSKENFHSTPLLKSSFSMVSPSTLQSSADNLNHHTMTFSAADALHLATSSDVLEVAAPPPPPLSPLLMPLPALESSSVSTTVPNRVITANNLNRIRDENTEGGDRDHSIDGTGNGRGDESDPTSPSPLATEPTLLAELEAEAAEGEPEKLQGLPIEVRVRPRRHLPRGKVVLLTPAAERIEVRFRPDAHIPQAAPPPLSQEERARLIAQLQRVASPIAYGRAAYTSNSNSSNSNARALQQQRRKHVASKKTIFSVGSSTASVSGAGRGSSCSRTGGKGELRDSGGSVKVPSSPSRQATPSATYSSSSSSVSFCGHQPTVMHNGSFSSAPCVPPPPFSGSSSLRFAESDASGRLPLTRTTLGASRNLLTPTSTMTTPTATPDASKRLAHPTRRSESGRGMERDAIRAEERRAGQRTSPCSDGHNVRNESVKDECGIAVGSRSVEGRREEWDSSFPGFGSMWWNLPFVADKNEERTAGDGGRNKTKRGSSGRDEKLEHPHYNDCSAEVIRKDSGQGMSAEASLRTHRTPSLSSSSPSPLSPPSMLAVRHRPIFSSRSGENIHEWGRGNRNGGRSDEGGGDGRRAPVKSSSCSPIARHRGNCGTRREPIRFHQNSSRAVSPNKRRSETEEEEKEEWMAFQVAAAIPPEAGEVVETGSFVSRNPQYLSSPRDSRSGSSRVWSVMDNDECYMEENHCLPLLSGSTLLPHLSELRAGDTNSPGNKSDRSEGSRGSGGIEKRVRMARSDSEVEIDQGQRREVFSRACHNDNNSFSNLVDLDGDNEQLERKVDACALTSSASSLPFGRYSPESRHTVLSTTTMIERDSRSEGEAFDLSRVLPSFPSRTGVRRQREIFSFYCRSRMKEGNLSSEAVVGEEKEADNDRDLQTVAQIERKKGTDREKERGDRCAGTVRQPNHFSHHFSTGRFSSSSSIVLPQNDNSQRLNRLQANPSSSQQPYFESSSEDDDWNDDDEDDVDEEEEERE